MLEYNRKQRASAQTLANRRAEKSVPPDVGRKVKSWSQCILSAGVRFCVGVDRVGMDGSVARAAVGGVLAAYARQHPGLTFVGVLSTLVVPLQDVLLPHLTGRVVNAIRGGDGAAMRRSIVWVGTAILLLQLAFVAVDVVDAVLLPSMQKFVRRRMLACLLDTHDASHSSELPVGEIISKFSKTPPMLVSWFESVKGMLPNLLVYVAATAYFWSIDRWLGVGLLAAVVASFAALAYNLERCGGVSSARDETLNAVHEQIDEMLHNLPAIYASGTKADEARRMAPIEDEFERLFYRTIMCATTVKVWMVPACILLVAGVLWRCYGLLLAETLSVGTFVSVFTVVLYLMASMMRVVAHSRQMAYHWGTIRSSAGMLSCVGAGVNALAPDARRDGEDALAVLAALAKEGDKGPAALVSLRGVAFSHADAGRPALVGVDLDLRAGERVAVVGRMGSGKSTLLKLLLRLVEPTAGELQWSGRPYASMRVSEVRAHFGYVPQSAPLFDRTVLENAVYGTSGASEADALRVAAELGLAPVFAALPGGLGERVGKGGSKLSGGQRQAVWILRMALLRPDVLVLDEATASMDRESQAAVAAAVARFPTVVIVSHDDAFVRSVATRVVHLRDGRVVDPPAPAPPAPPPPPSNDDADDDDDATRGAAPDRDEVWEYAGDW
jgi:ABC-type multidrug transport system fused ATPase/permease subunit